jgi:uncharacterized oligopeptide transporter (OPT) family protein
LLGLAGKLRVPPLAVGIGIYLPMSATFAVVLGAVVGDWYERRIAAPPGASDSRVRAADRSQRLGVLVASGLIVGESLFGVLNAGLIVAFSNEAPLALVPADFGLANIIGLVSFTALVIYLYWWMLRRSTTS